MPGRPSAVVFDVDGTLVDSERHGHRVAFNDAFAAFGLPHHWDEVRYGELLTVTGGQARLRTFLSSCGYPEAEVERLAAELHQYKTERFRQLCDEAQIPARPGVRELLDDVASANFTVAVATTGSRSWVEPLLDRLFGLERFSCIVAGSEVTERKPAGEVYTVTCDRLGVAPYQAVAVEDSAVGLQSAQEAGLPCLVVVNDYTRDDDVSGAALVVDAFRQATVLQGPLTLLDEGAVTADTIAAIGAHAAA